MCSLLNSIEPEAVENLINNFITRLGDSIQLTTIFMLDEQGNSSNTDTYFVGICKYNENFIYSI